MVVRTALYLDFDNFFGGLVKHNRVQALRVANSPSVWTANLAGRHTIDGARRWLVRRCYLNPTGEIQDALLPTGHTEQFSAFRQRHVQAGFEVIDCPTLTDNGKNAADIRLVVDVMDALHGPVQYDEFVIASGDADLTPLLTRIKAHDRRITIVSPEHVAAAYRSLADRFLDHRDVVELLDKTAQPTTPLASEETAATTPANAAPVPPDNADAADLLQHFRSLITDELQRSPDGIYLSALSPRLRSHLPDTVTVNWFGYKKISTAIAALGVPGLEVGQYKVTYTPAP